MKIFKRIIVVVLFIPLVVVSFIELIFYIIRWVLTGIEFSENPLLFRFLDKWT